MTLTARAGATPAPAGSERPRGPTCGHRRRTRSSPAPRPRHMPPRSARSGRTAGPRSRIPPQRRQPIRLDLSRSQNRSSGEPRTAESPKTLVTSCGSFGRTLFPGGDVEHARQAGGGGEPLGLTQRPLHRPVPPIDKPATKVSRRSVDRRKNCRPDAAAPGEERPVAAAVRLVGVVAAVHLGHHHGEPERRDDVRSRAAQPDRVVVAEASAGTTPVTGRCCGGRPCRSGWRSAAAGARHHVLRPRTSEKKSHRRWATGQAC